MTNKNISIAGAGLVGSLIAVILAKRGYTVKIYERRSDLRKEDISAGRSINLALSDRGLKALSLAGVRDKVDEMVIPMKGRMMHDTEGTLTFQPYGKDGQAINSISRGGLNAMLMNEAESLGVEIHFSHRCENIDLKNTTLHLSHEGRSFEVKSDIILGCDGAYSSARSAFQITDRFNYNQHYIDHGYKELHIPAVDGDKFAIDKNALHIWPRGHFMLIALPNLDGSFTVTLFLPFEGEPSFRHLNSDTRIREFFQNTFPDVMPVSPDLLKDFNNNPTSSLVTVKCYPWVRQNTLLLGDAAHAIVPFYGQGMNAGFEDCTVLTNLLDEYNDDWEMVLSHFQTGRKPDADAIADLALRNFVEMRDSVADKRFLKRKQIEARLHDLYPDKWIPLYSMVTFSHIPYAFAQAEGHKQDRIMTEVMEKYSISTPLDEINYEWIIKKLG